MKFFLVLRVFSPFTWTALSQVFFMASRPHVEQFTASGAMKGYREEVRVSVEWP